MTFVDKMPNNSSLIIIAHFGEKQIHWKEVNDQIAIWPWSGGLLGQYWVIEISMNYLGTYKLDAVIET